MVLCLPCPFLACIDDELQTAVNGIIRQLVDWTFGWPINLVLLRRNAELLRNEMRRLRQMAEDVEARVATEVARPRTVRTSQMDGWLQEARAVGDEVDRFREAFDRQYSILSTGFCLGYSAAKLLEEVRNLRSRASELGDGFVGAPPAASDLAEEMARLRACRDDLLREVEVLETGNSQLKRTSQVKRWLEMAEAVLNGEMETGLNLDLLRKVRSVMMERDRITGDLVTKALPAAVEPVPGSSSASSLLCRVGTLTEIGCHLQNQDIKMVGICGAGGVGKTALLQAINIEFDKVSRNSCAVPPFDVVIMVAASRSMNLLQIQRDIGDRIGLSLRGDGESGQRDDLVRKQAKELFRVLSKKRFLLLLDDVWEELILGDVGIPHPDMDDDYYNQSKIVFATRDEQVCDDMLRQCGDVRSRAKVAVSFLCPGHAWELFWKTCGNEGEAFADPRILPLAEKVIQHCGGLPLALLTVGKAMAGKKQPQLWQDAVRKLEYDPKEIRGMESKVLKSIEFSFSELKDEMLKQCLLYCSLFPESREIDRNQLVEYLIGDGLVDAQDDGDDKIDNARGRGQSHIDDLVSAHMLERGIVDEQNRVRLHDVVRAMALWLTKEGAEATVRFVNLAGRGIEDLRRTENWAGATRVSLMKNKLTGLPDDIPRCPMLTTLLAGDQEIDADSIAGKEEQRTYDPPPMHPPTSGVNSIKAVLHPTSSHKLFSIPPSFFQFTGALCVLDLSNTLIFQIPSTIGLLGELVFLKLSGTTIRRLPKELGTLRKLRQLDLSGTEHLTEIPQEAISTLEMLQTLNVYDSVYNWPQGLYRVGHERGMQASLRCLERLRHLDELGVCLRSLLPLRSVASSKRLSRLVRFLKISAAHLTASEMSATLKSLASLHELYLANCSMLEHLEFVDGQPRSLEVLQLCSLHSLSRVGSIGLPVLANLRRLYILGCPMLSDVAWLGTLPWLQEMHLYNCELMEELLPPTWPCGNDPFPNLRELHLADLPGLRCICRRPLRFPSLQTIEVYRCAQLRDLSVLPRGGLSIYQIRGAQEWWDALAWEEDEDGNSAEPRLSRKFTAGEQTFYLGCKVMMCIKDRGRELTLYPKLPKTLVS